MYVYRLICILMVLCHSTFASYKSFDSEGLKLRWFTAFKVKALYERVNPEAPIKEPMATWVPILEIYYHTKTFEEKKDCLIYFTPGNNKLGVIKAIELKTSQDCKKHIFNSSLVMKNNIFNFNFRIEKDLLTLWSDDKSYQYKFHSDRTKLSLAIIDAEQTVPKPKKGEVCSFLDDDCKVVREDICRRCDDGIFTELVGSACLKGYKKVCGDIECGVKGNPACIRGFRGISFDSINYCINDSPAAFCRDQSRVICINKELVCR